jgi:CDP-6-deoxy-D-xylo-4-hexulose-3-dehydrase
MNLRSTDLQAFIGLRAVDKLKKYGVKRYGNFLTYQSLIKTNELTISERDGDFISNFAYPMVNKNRTAIIKELQEANVEVRPLIAGNIANHPFWVDKYDVPELPNADLLDEFGFYLPNHQDLSQDDIMTITNIVNKYE